MDMRLDSPLRFQFITVFFFRRVVYASVFMLAANLQNIQIGVAVATVVGMASYIIIVKPYASGLSSVLSVINEFLLLATVAIPGRFLEPVISPQNSRVYGSALVALIIGTIVINWIGIMIFASISFIGKKARSNKLKKLRKEHMKIKKSNEF